MPTRSRIVVYGKNESTDEFSNGTAVRIKVRIDASETVGCHLILRLRGSLMNTDRTTAYPSGQLLDAHGKLLCYAPTQPHEYTDRAVFEPGTVEIPYLLLGVPEGEYEIVAYVLDPVTREAVIDESGPRLVSSQPFTVSGQITDDLLRMCVSRLQDRASLEAAIREEVMRNRDRCLGAGLAPERLLMFNLDGGRLTELTPGRLVVIAIDYHELNPIYSFAQLLTSEHVPDQRGHDVPTGRVFLEINPFHELGKSFEDIVQPEEIRDLLPDDILLKYICIPMPTSFCRLDGFFSYRLDPNEAFGDRAVNPPDGWRRTSLVGFKSRVELLDNSPTARGYVDAFKLNIVVYGIDMPLWARRRIGRAVQDFFKHAWWRYFSIRGVNVIGLELPVRTEEVIAWWNSLQPKDPDRAFDLENPMHIAVLRSAYAAQHGWLDISTADAAMIRRYHPGSGDKDFTLYFNFVRRNAAPGPGFLGPSGGSDAWNHAFCRCPLFRFFEPDSLQPGADGRYGRPRGYTEQGPSEEFKYDGIWQTDVIGVAVHEISHSLFKEPIGVFVNHVNPYSRKRIGSNQLMERFSFHGGLLENGRVGDQDALNVLMSQERKYNRETQISDHQVAAVVNAYGRLYDLRADLWRRSRPMPVTRTASRRPGR